MARSAPFALAFRWPFRLGFRLLFPISEGGAAAIWHQRGLCGEPVLPTSPRSIEVWS